jgi:hypothetical protein
MMKRAIILLTILVLLASSFMGCSSMNKSANDSYVMETAANTTAGYGSPELEDSFSEDKAGSSVVYDRDESSGSGSNETGAGVDDQSIRKEIKNGDIAVEVKDVEAAYPGIMKIVDDLGGYEFNKSFYTSNNHKRMDLVIKLPPEKLDEFQNKLVEFVGNGKVTKIVLQSQDITSQYYDTQSRLDSYILSRSKFEEIMEKAETVEDILRVQNELTRIQAEIDSLQGRINMWDKLIALATINLYIDEEDDPVRRTQTMTWKFNSFEDILRTIKNGFISVVNTLYSIVTWIIIIIISISPILVIAGAVLWIILRRRKKLKGKTEKVPE